MKLHHDAVSAVSCIASGQRVFVHGAAATPSILIDGLVARAPDLRDVELIHLHTFGPAPYAAPALAQSFRVANLFVGENLRAALDLDRIDYLPCFLSEIPQMFRSGRRPLDVALIHVSPPDAHGYCTLGTSVDVARAAVDEAKIVIAQINPRMPRVHGDGMVHVDRIDHAVNVDVPLVEIAPSTPSEAEAAIGRHVAGLVDEGSTLQLGIGAVPDAVCRALGDHRHLGIHSEMWSDGALSLIERGAVDNSLKAIHPGRTVSGFVMGSRRVYAFIHDNPAVAQLDIGYVNNPTVIARNPKVHAINSAVEIDLTGQVCADSVGSRIVSGVGGQMDFMRGAALSRGGKPILALTSRTKSGAPRLVSTLAKGAGVITTRSHVHWVVTEYGVADLYARTLGERARALIAIAHPDDRARLEEEWSKIRSRQG